MDGLLVINKPVGPTSHDVVARVRRALGEARVGHTGTLDPAADGVLPLVIGRATRLARFMSGSTKAYDAIVRLGLRTDTGDAEGRPEPAGAPAALPSAESVDRALAPFRGTFLQQPPAFSAKKIAGKRSYALARRRRSLDSQAAVGVADALPAPVTVTTTALELVRMDGMDVVLRIECSAGFYVRSLAQDLGERLGIGGHLAGLRRTRSGDFTLSDAIGLEELEADGPDAAARVIPMSRLLPELPPAVLTAEGVRFARNGRELGPAAFEPGAPATAPARFVRLLDSAGDLVGIGEAAERPGLLHPAVILM